MKQLSTIFVVHLAGTPTGPRQHCTDCGICLRDNTRWIEGHARYTEGEAAHGPSWWPIGALVATGITAPGRGGYTYPLDPPGRPLNEDEQLCATLPTRPLMDPREFLAGGYLAEINRRVLHPLGLALVVEETDDGTLRIMGVEDHRADPEGVHFADVAHIAHKAAKVAAQEAKRRPAREAALGYWIQPVNADADQR